MLPCSLNSTRVQGGVAMAAQAPTTMDLWLEEPSARSPGSEELYFPALTKQSLLLLVKFCDPASQTLRVRPCGLPGSTHPAATPYPALLDGL